MDSETLNTDTRSLRVAVVQAESIPFNLKANVEKACKLITEASQNGAKLVAFPELFIPGYPFWIWTRVDMELTTLYIKQSLKRDSLQMQKICDTASENRIAVSLGFSENENNSLYIAQALIGPDGQVLCHRRKIKPTHVERSIFGEGSGSSILNVVEVSGLGKVGGLCCWEHTQPLLKYHTHAQGEEIHVAAWPPMLSFEDKSTWMASKEGCRNMSRNHAMEGSCFVLYANGVLSQNSVDLMKTGGSDQYNRPGGGASAVFGPDGRLLSKETLGEEEEGLVYADLDFDDIVRSKALLDTYGHYSRPDLLWLGVDASEKKHVRHI